MNKNWIFIILAGIIEVLWAIGLKYSNGLMAWIVVGMAYFNEAFSWLL